MLPFHVFAPILLQLFWSKTIFSSFLIPFPLQVRFRNYRQIIFTRNIFSSFPIIHRGKRTFHKMMTFSIRYFVTLRSLHISRTVFLNTYSTYLFLFFFFFYRFSLLPKVYLYPRECFPSDVQRQWPRRRRRRRRRRDISVGVTIGVGAIISVVG